MGPKSLRFARYAVCSPSSIRPFPIKYFGHVVTVLADIPLMRSEFVAHCLCRLCSRRAQLRHTIDYVHDKVESVDIVQHGHVERRCGRPLFLVSAYMKVAVARPAVRKAVNQPRVSVKREDDRLVLREERIEVPVGQTVRVLAFGL